MKVYNIRRDPDGIVRCEVLDEGGATPLNHVAVHSPDGFEYGYAGSGPADLALSILADYFEEWDSTIPSKSYSERGAAVPNAWQFHQAFKFAMICGQNGEGFSITEGAVRWWIRQESLRRRRISRSKREETTWT